MNFAPEDETQSTGKSDESQERQRPSIQRRLTAFVRGPVLDSDEDEGQAQSTQPPGEFTGFRNRMS